VFATAVGVFARGGFPDAARALFALFAGSALLAAAVSSPEASLRAARSPAVVVLGALAAVAVASAAWTIGAPADALRYGLVAAGYGALTVSAAVIARDRRAQTAIYAAIAVLAAIVGVLGLIGVGVEEFPFGQRVGGSWEAGGSFEYGPANALLQVAALPILLTGMAVGSRRLAIAAAGGTAIAAAVIVLSDSLFCQVAGMTVLAIAIACPGPTLGRPRSLAAAAAALALATALATHVVAGRYTPPCELGGDGARLSALAGTIIATAAIWALARRVLIGERSTPIGPICAVAAAAVLAIAGAVADPEGSCSAPTEGVEPYAGVLHGRIGLWDAAYDAARDRPLAGSGADTYGLASSRYQDGDHVLYAHNLPLELWVELGITGALLAVGLYAAVGTALAAARRSPALWLAGTAVAAFMLANLVDFPWHLAGAGAVWALALGVVIAAGGHNQTGPR
jgi:hypothetical protein